MEDKIQAITQKILKEGVEQGEAEAAKVVQAAEAEAAKLLDAAKTEATRLVAEAQNKAEEARKASDAELKLAAAQAMSAVKHQIAEAVTVRALDGSVNQALTPPVVAGMVKAMLERWKAGEASSLEVLLPEAQRAELEGMMEKDVLGALSAGLSVKLTKDLKGGFQVGPSDGRYRLSFTDEDFREFFRQYLKPRTRELLFGA